MNVTMSSQERLARVVLAYKDDLNKIWTEEADLLEKAIELLTVAGASINREADATRRGVADLIVCYNGRFIAIELKDDQGVPSKQQLKYIAEVQEAKGLAAVCRTLREIVALLLAAS